MKEVCTLVLIASGPCGGREAKAEKIQASKWFDRTPANPLHDSGGSKAIFL